MRRHWDALRAPETIVVAGDRYGVEAIIRGPMDTFKSCLAPSHLSQSGMFLNAEHKQTRSAAVWVLGGILISKFPRDSECCTDYMRRYLRLAITLLLFFLPAFV